MLNTLLSIAALSTWLVPADVPEEQAKGKKYVSFNQGKFTFVRAEYDSIGGEGEAYYWYDGRLWMRWQTDFPEAEENFLYRIEELTTLKVERKPISLRLTDDKLFDYPFLYMCDVGWQHLSRAELKGLRAYLDRGGFLWADDFWGLAEWENFRFNMAQAFPDKQWRTIPKDHPILNMVFPLKECPMIPAKIFWDGGWPHDPPGAHRQPAGGMEGVDHVNFMGLFDDNDRLMAVATHNTDIGDGWEREAEDKNFFKEFSVNSYAIGINIVVYALTH